MAILQNMGGKTLAGYNLVASFKTPVYLTVVIFWMHTGHQVVSIRLELDFHLPSLL